MTKADPHVQIAKGAPSNPIASLITPGRRALGEDWSKVHIGWDDDAGEYTVDREDTPAPADGKPIFVPALGNLSWEAVDFILEEQRKEAEYRKARGKQGMSDAELNVLLNRMWQDFVAIKLKHFRGESTVGAGGLFQRERVTHSGT